MYHWWHSLLFICAIACSDAHREKSISTDSLNLKTIQESSISKSILQRLQFPDQHVTQIPVSMLQVVSGVQSRFPISDQYRLLPRSQKRYKSRLFKRAVEMPDAFMISFKAAIREAVREILAETKEFSDDSKLQDVWSRINENSGSLPSDAEINLRSIDFHSKDNRSDFEPQPQPSLEHGTTELAQGLQIWSTGSLFTNKPEGKFVDSPSEQVSLKSQTLLQMKPSVTTLPSGTTKSFHYSNLTNTVTQESSNSITKVPFALTDSVFENSSLEMILASHFKTSLGKLESTELLIKEKSPTDSGLMTLIVTKDAELFSSKRKTSSSPIKHSMPQNDHTSSPFFISDSPYTQPDLSHSTFDFPRFTTGKGFETSVSFALNNNFADVDEITSTKEKSVPSSKMGSTSMTAVITSLLPIKSDFTATQISHSHKSTGAGTSVNKVEPTNTASNLLNHLTSFSPKPVGSMEGNLASTETVSLNTDYEMLSSTIPVPIKGRDHSSCILKVRNATTIVQTPLVEQTMYENETIFWDRIKTSLNPNSETLFTSTLAPTELTSAVSHSQFTDSYAIDQKENSSIIPLYLVVDQHSPESTVLNSTVLIPFRERFPASPKSTEFPTSASLMSAEFPNTTTLSLEDFDIFHDAIDENMNLNQISHNMTGTSSTVLPLQFSKSLTSMLPSWNAENTLQTKTTMQNTNSTRTTESSKLRPETQTQQSRGLHSTTHMKPMFSHADASISALNFPFTVTQYSKTTIKPPSSVNTSEMSTSVMTSQMSTPKILKQTTSDSLSESTFLESKNTFNRTKTFRSGNSQRYNISTTPKSSISYSTSLITKQNQAIPSTAHVKSEFSTSVLKPLSTLLMHTNFTKTSRKTLETPALKIWIPQSLDVPIKNTTTDVIAISNNLPVIQTSRHTTSSIPAMVSVPLAFQLTGVSYSKQLSNHSTAEYMRLEKEVILVLNKVFTIKYQQEFVQAEILGFSEGSVIVKSKIVFGDPSSTPSSSDIVRTLLSDDTAVKNNYFGWKINASTVESNGYTPKNLEQESLSISFVVLHYGFIATSQNYQEKHAYLQSLQSEMLLAINKSFPVTDISLSQIRNLYGDLEVSGNLFLQSRTFTDVKVLLSTLLPLANESVDLCSVTVDGIHNELKVYPFNFRVTNMQFVVNLLNMASKESQKLSKDLSNVIMSTLNDKNLLQVVIREFYSGSVVCKGDLIYRFPAPGSGEVLRQFLQARKSDSMLGSSAYKVDFQSVTIGDSTSSPYNEYTDFPGFAVAIIVMCGLAILIFPLLAFVCYKTRMLGHRNKATFRQRHDPDQQSHHFEMDNRAFRASIEQP
ncbi:uncharacterized protein ACMZJ9_004682 [Mantella aurantiaca]